MNDLLFTPIRLNELEVLIENSVQRAIKCNSLNTEPQPEPDNPLNIDEVATLTGYTKPTIYGYCQKNEIPYYKKNGRLFFFKSEIILWLKSSKQKTLKELEADAGAYLSKNKKRV